MSWYLYLCWQVSIFLRDKVQHNTTGRFVMPISGSLPVDVELPGKIRSPVLISELIVDTWDNEMSAVKTTAQTVNV